MVKSAYPPPPPKGPESKGARPMWKNKQKMPKQIAPKMPKKRTGKAVVPKKMGY